MAQTVARVWGYETDAIEVRGAVSGAGSDLKEIFRVKYIDKTFK